MRILVTGGTGFIGKPLVRALVANGHQVTVFGREDDVDRPDSVKMVTGDVTNKLALRKAFSSVEAVYHLAACMNEDDPRLFDVNVKGTEKVAELCKEKKVKRLVFMSSAGVLGETKIPAREHTFHNPMTKLDKSKSAAEKIVKNSGVPYTIIRAPPVIGANVTWSKIFEAIKKGSPVVGSGKNKFHLVHVDDVVRMLTLVMESRKAADQVFHVAAKDILTYEEVHELIRKHMRAQEKGNMSPKLASLLSSLHWIKTGIQARPTSPHLTKHFLHLATTDSVLSIKKAQQMLGFEPYYTTPAAINLAVRDLR